MSTPLLKELLRLEEAVDYRRSPKSNEASFSIENGKRRVLISAPHGSAHIRKGLLKPEEEFTTAITRFLARKTGAYAIYATHMHRGDPNWDKSSRYKQAIKELVEREEISFLIDLHGMTNRHGIGIAIGTMNGRSCPDHEAPVSDLFRSSGYDELAPDVTPPPLTKTHPKWGTFVVNHPRFTGGIVSHTITRYAAEELRISAVQIELASQIRIVERGPYGSWPKYVGNPEAIRTTIETLSTLVTEII
ncbi:MAG: hypothetical protein AAF633_27345 [Chloroflexota bacterium]